MKTFNINQIFYQTKSTRLEQQFPASQNVFLKDKMTLAEATVFYKDAVQGLATTENGKVVIKLRLCLDGFPLKHFPNQFLLLNQRYSHFSIHFRSNTSLFEYTQAQFHSKYPKHIQAFPKYSTWFPEIILHNLKLKDEI